MNILVYSGSGSGAYSLQHCLVSLRELLGSSYAVSPITGEQIIKEPWPQTCAALVFPGGADQAYSRVLNGLGNSRIRHFVERGGVYIGFCAGGYYGSQRCEFEVDNKPLEVIGARELAFFPGIARGAAFPGFVYNSEEGARAAELRIDLKSRAGFELPETFRSYFNGGGVFVNAPQCKDHHVEVLASYTESLAVDPGEGSAAVVYRRIGHGNALLTGSHPEFAAARLHKQKDCPGFDKVIQELLEHERARRAFLTACLAYTGLKIATTEDQVSPCLHFSSLRPTILADVWKSFKGISIVQNGREYIKDVADEFLMSQSHCDCGQREGCQPSHDEATIIEMHKHEENHLIATSFDHRTYYANLEKEANAKPVAKSRFGHLLLYGEVMGSTNSLLEKNTRLLQCLPTGSVALATSQVAGRGRGSNVWLSPRGSLMFSVVIRQSMALMQSAPVVFIQYLAAIAVVEAAKSFDHGRFSNLPLKLKWPNDIYARDICKSYPTPSTSRAKQTRDQYVKIGGVLVNSTYNSHDYIMVCGIGLNLSNNSPTTSLNAVASFYLNSKNSQSASEQQEALSPQTPDKPFLPEAFLPAILTTFDALYTRFLCTGFDRGLQENYYQHWLHDNQIISLDAEAKSEAANISTAWNSTITERNSGEHEASSINARINGITSEFGLLVVEEVVPTTTKLEHSSSDGDNKNKNNDNDNDSNVIDIANNDEVEAARRPSGGEEEEEGKVLKAKKPEWKPTGQKWTLQSDGNSFDFFHGLIKRKL